MSAICSRAGSTVATTGASNSPGPTGATASSSTPPSSAPTSSTSWSSVRSPRTANPDRTSISGRLFAIPTSRRSDAARTTSSSRSRRSTPTSTTTSPRPPRSTTAIAAARRPAWSSPAAIRICVRRCCGASASRFATRTPAADKTWPWAKRWAATRRWSIRAAFCALAARSPGR